MSAATEATRVRDSVLARAADPKRERWLEQVARTGHCSRPVRLRGRVLSRRAGRTRETYSTSVEPDQTLMVRCGNRRASVCPSCSHEYRGDMWQLLYAGCVGGRKGVPESVREHPLVFLTLTAPGFGPVHTIRADGSCRPGAGCDERHDESDPRLGEPLDPGTYDYEAAALFNWHAPELWRRFTIALRRELASQLKASERGLRDIARLSFAKVAEFQRRGVVHFHALVRLDGPDGPGCAAPSVDMNALGDAIRRAAAKVRLDVARASTGEILELGFGAQVDWRPLVDSAAADTTDPAAAAAYISKYATKATEDFGVGGRRVAPSDVDTLEVREHVARLIRACAELEATCPGIERWLHMLGFRGHFSTKSRRFSTTLGALREERARYRREQSADVDVETTAVIGEWQFLGIGYLSPGDAALAGAGRQHREQSRELMALDHSRGAP